MSVAEFLKGLPSYDRENFSRYHSEANNMRVSSKRPSVYLPTQEYPSEQVIVTEKTSVFLKYLQEAWDRKVMMLHKKRDHTALDSDSDSNNSRKRVRFEPSISVMN